MPNQSRGDGLSFRTFPLSPFPIPVFYPGKLTSQVPGQKLPACVCPEDEYMHPSPGKGRGAPEIDALEAGVDTAGRRTGSQSMQIVRARPTYQPRTRCLPTKTHMGSWYGKC